MKTAMFVGQLMIMMLALIIWILISLYKWTKEDAVSRGMENPVMWGLIVALVPNLIGLIVYLVVRITHQPSALCGECGRRVPKYAGYCPACGAVQTAPVVVVERPALKPTRHLVRAGIGFGCFVVLTIGVMVVVSIASTRGYVDGTQVSLINVSGSGSGALMTEIDRSDSYELVFGIWQGERKGTLDAEGTLVCKVEVEEGVLWVDITTPQFGTIRVEAGETHEIDFNRRQKVQYVVHGENATRGSVNIKCEK